MVSANLLPQRCGIILAGGDGKRLQPFIRRMLGVNLPKQYVCFMGTRSMLEHTLDRAERLIPRERIFTVVARDHLRHLEVQRQIGKRLPHTWVLQPTNKETGPGILLPLMHLLKKYPNSTVAVFPSDHFILQEERFMAYVCRAFEAVEQVPTRIVFLAVEPTNADPEYGYILPEEGFADSSSLVRTVKTFVEKPAPPLARQVISLGGLWNTMVMVFRPEILLNLVAVSQPKLHRSFHRIFDALGTSRESFVIEKSYRKMEPVNFSKDLLEGFDLHSRSQLFVVRMKGVFWSDWGSEDRVLSVLEGHEYLDGVLSGLSLEAERRKLPAPDGRLQAIS
jgi:mannose-1-phosphate guanylyltransferase